MKLRHLRCFQTVAEELHFGRAAERLHVDQSSVSKNIKELENKLGKMLFLRNPRSVKLTNEGQIYYQEIIHIFSLLDAARNKVQSIGLKKHFKFAFSSNVSIDTHQLSELFRYCREEMPEMHISVEEIGHLKLLKGIRDGSYDFGFSCSSDIGNQPIQIKKMGDDKLVLLLPSRHPLVEFNEISMKVLTQYTFISYHPDTVMNKQISIILNQSNVVPSKVEYAKSYEVLLSLVAAGFGIALVTETMYRNMQNDNVLIRKIVENPTVGSYLLYSKQSLQHQFLKKIAERLSVC